MALDKWMYQKQFKHWIVEQKKTEENDAWKNIYLDER